MAKFTGQIVRHGGEVSVPFELQPVLHVGRDLLQRAAGVTREEHVLAAT